MALVFPMSEHCIRLHEGSSSAVVFSPCFSHHSRENGPRALRFSKDATWDPFLGCPPHSHNMAALLKTSHLYSRQEEEVKVKGIAS